MSLPDGIGHIPTAAALRDRSRTIIGELEAIVTGQKAIIEQQRREIAELRRRIEDAGELIKLARPATEPSEGS